MLDRVAHFFSGAAFFTLDGKPVHAIPRQPRAVQDTFSPTKVSRRVIVVPKDSPVRTGDIITDGEGVTYILGSWPNDVFLGHVVARQYVLFECNGQFAWTRLGASIDPVSGLRRPGIPTTLGMIWGLMERTRVNGDGKGFDSYLKRLVTASDVMTGDQIDGQKVTFTEKSFGLTVADLA